MNGNLYQSCPICGDKAKTVHEHTVNVARKRVIDAMEACVTWVRGFDLEIDEVVSNLILEYDTASQALAKLEGVNSNE